MNNQNPKSKINRRQFLRSSAVLGAGLVWAPRSFSQQMAAKTEDINVALLGAGEQGQVLANACLKMGSSAGVCFKALCDIWQYNQDKALARLKAYDHQPAVYVDYKEMLDKEKNLNAVIIATPDFWHAEQTVACLKAGLNVYCESQMSNTPEGAGRMVKAARESGKLLQIGHQRRSSPLYIHCCDKLLKDAKILGRLVAVNGQWNRSVQPDLGSPPKYAIDQAILEKYGFGSMQQFRNWRWYKGLGSGPVVEYGSHQIDVFNWFLGTAPKSVLAAGGTDYYDKDGHQWYDNVMVIYEYELEQRAVRAVYQVITANSSQGHFEKFMGAEGTLIMSDASGESGIYREPWVSAEKWEQWVGKEYLKKTAAASHSSDDGSALEVRSSVAAGGYEFPVKTDKPYHQLHLENFFDAVRGRAKLNCPAEVAYESAVTVLKINEAITTGTKLNFAPEDFKVAN